jgi:uncharacterized protein (DUF58 family)
LDAITLLQQVRRIEIKTRRLSDQLFSGEYQSSFKGRGMSFAEVRPYQSGDDVRSIDWNVTARKRAPYIKVFEEERELTLFLVIDISKSILFGTSERSKRDSLTEIAATLAFSAMGNNDKIGIILFAGEVEKVIPPKKGKKHVMRIIQTLLEWEPQSSGTNIDLAMEHLLKIQKRHSNVFLMSDFMGNLPDKSFKIAAKRYDLCAIHSFDEKEISLPSLGMVPMQDLETGAVCWINTNSRELRNKLIERFEYKNTQLSTLAKRSGAGLISVEMNEDYVPPLLNYLKSKSR